MIINDYNKELRQSKNHDLLILLLENYRCENRMVLYIIYILLYDLLTTPLDHKILQ